MPPDEHGWSYIDDAISGRSAEPRRRHRNGAGRLARLALALLPLCALAAAAWVAEKMAAAADRAFWRLTGWVHQ